MAARKSNRVTRKLQDEVSRDNWPEYERGLRSRGDITVWFSEEARDAWTPPKNGRRGDPRRQPLRARGQPRSLTPRSSGRSSSTHPDKLDWGLTVEESRCDALRKKSQAKALCPRQEVRQDSPA